MKKNILSAGLILFCLLVGMGCLDNNNIRTVQKSAFPGYEAAPVGKILSRQFDDPSWKTFEGENGAVVVEFRGKISKSLHDRAVELLMEQAFMEFVQAMLYGDGMEFLGLTLQLQNVLNTLGPEVSKQLPKKLEEAGVAEEVRNLAPLLIVIDKNVWLTGQEVEIQWVQQVSTGKFQLHYLGGDAIKGVDSDGALDIICGKPVAYQNAELKRNVENKMKELFSRKKTIFLVYSNLSVMSESSLTDSKKGSSAGSEPGKKPLQTGKPIVPENNLSKMEARFIEASMNHAFVGEWAVIGTIQGQYSSGQYVRIAAQAPWDGEGSFRFGGDFLILDYDGQVPLIPSIMVGSKIVSTVEEMMSVYDEMDFYNAYVDGEFVGRIEYFIYPDASETFIYFSPKTTNNPGHIYTEMKTGKQLRLVNDSKENEFLFNLEGLSEIEKKVEQAVKELSNH